MTKVFPAWRVESSERRLDQATGQMTPWQAAGGSFEVAQEAEDYINETLGKRFGISPFFLINLTKEPSTWAAVFFTDIISGSDQVLDACGELRGEIGFAAYGTAELGMSNPPLGAMALKNAKALEIASSRHEVFGKAWEALRLCSTDSHWVAVVDL